MDLAGSERARSTGAEGARFKEGVSINSSLFHLSMAITNLSVGKLVSYRSSVLTRILQPALGGNSRLAIVCTVTPALEHLAETISTLEFASRAKRIKTKVSINKVRRV